MPSDFMISLIIPAYNEIHCIGQTIAEVKAYFEQQGYTYEIIISADGDDGTRELVAEMAKIDSTLKIIGNIERRGKGHAIREGVALSQGDLIGFIDADNKTPIEEFDKVKPLLDNGYDVVIGSRALQGARIERSQRWYCRVGSVGFRIFMQTIAGLHHIPDTQCGFKFFQRHVAMSLFPRQRIDGYMFDVEILYLAQQAGYRIGQVPIRWRDDGDSRLELLRGNIRNVVDIFRIRFLHSQVTVAHSLRPAPTNRVGD
jgi:dolichyl-phosphate beta-glucosyltransferase